jgi:hypothetical protein
MLLLTGLTSSDTWLRLPKESLRLLLQRVLSMRHWYSHLFHRQWTVSAGSQQFNALWGIVQWVLTVAWGYSRIMKEKHCAMSQITSKSSETTEIRNRRTVVTEGKRDNTACCSWRWRFRNRSGCYVHPLQLERVCCMLQIKKSMKSHFILRILTRHT